MEREWEEMIEDVGIEKKREGDGQKGQKKKKNLCNYLFNFGSKMGMQTSGSGPDILGSALLGSLTPP